MTAADVAYIAKQTPETRAQLEKLRALIWKTLPDATVALKWGVPVYAVDGRNVCALSVFKDFIGLNFLASPDVLPDPKKRLEGSGKTQRMLKIRKPADIEGASIRRWLKAAARR